jgi:hypothetical protein
MGLRPCGKKWENRVSRVTGLDVVRVVGNGGYSFGFVTADHRHGSFELYRYTAWIRRGGYLVDPPEGVFELGPVGYLGACWSSCEERWPDDVQRYRAEHFAGKA